MFWITIGFDQKGRALSWPEARAEWTKAHRKEYEKFLLETLSFPVMMFFIEGGLQLRQKEREISHHSTPHASLYHEFVRQTQIKRRWRR